MVNSKRFEGKGVYSNLAIKTAVYAGHIICRPFVKEHINGSSLDLTLGEWFYSINDKRLLSQPYNPFDKDHVDKKFSGPHKATPHSEMAERLNFNLLNNISPEHPIIIVQPGERILAHTHEFVGIKPPGTTSMHSRSTMGRNGIVTCHDAGWGDPGYINRWTLEIQNIDEHQSVVLPIGERVCQMVFHYTPEVEAEYSSLSGKYQEQDSAEIEKTIASWVPNQMLPKAYKDQRVIPSAQWRF